MGSVKSENCTAEISESNLIASDAANEDNASNDAEQCQKQLDKADNVELQKKDFNKMAEAMLDEFLSKPDARKLKPIDVKRGDNVSNVLKNFEKIKNDKNKTTLNFSADKKRNPFSTECLLIVDLLTMNYADRQQYLLDQAVKNQLLMCIKDTSTYVATPEVLATDTTKLPALDKFKKMFSTKTEVSANNATGFMRCLCDQPSKDCFIHRFCLRNSQERISHGNKNKGKSQNNPTADFSATINPFDNKKEYLCTKETKEMVAQFSKSKNEKDSIPIKKLEEMFVTIPKSNVPNERKRGKRGQKKLKNNDPWAMDSLYSTDEESISFLNSQSGNIPSKVFQNASFSSSTSSIVQRVELAELKSNTKNSSNNNNNNNINSKPIKKDMSGEPSSKTQNYKSKEKIVNINKDKIENKLHESNDNLLCSSNMEKKSKKLAKQIANSTSNALNDPETLEPLINKILNKEVKLNKTNSGIDGVSKNCENVNMKKEPGSSSSTTTSTNNVVAEPKNNRKSSLPPIKSKYSDFYSNEKTFPDTSLQLNHANILIAQLLTLPPNEQDQLILDLAIKYNILQRSLTNTCEINYKYKFDFVNKIGEYRHIDLGPKFPPFPYEIKKILHEHGVPIQPNLFIPNVLDEPNNLPKLELFIQNLIRLNIGYIVEGNIRVNEKNIEVAYVKTPNGVDGKIDSLILRQDAMHDDMVQAFIMNENLNRESTEEHPTAFVIKILEKTHSRIVVGTINSGFFLEPRTKRIPKVKIPKETLKDKFEVDTKAFYAVQIFKVLPDGTYIGKIVEKIDRVDDDLQKYNNVILKQYDLNPNVFGPNILADLPDESYLIPEDEYQKRDVLTNQCILTIDPATAKDLDDALSCRKLDNGNYEVGVHIADVTYFLKENTKLDDLVKNMTTSVYMVNTVYHMLPKSLCMLCSLLPGKDKLSFSVIWELTSDAEIQNVRFVKTIMNSCVQFSYEHAQKVIDSDEINADEFPAIQNGFTIDDVQKSIRNLHFLAMKLRQKRFDNGSIRFDQPKISFDLNAETGQPIAFYPQQLGESNFLIEEFMLLANQSVARFCYDLFPKTTILRKHTEPDKRQMNELQKRLNAAGYQMDIESSKSIALSYDRIANSGENKLAIQSVLNKMFSKPMQRAEYFCSSFAEDDSYLEHFALAMPIYTHFTSPIRRYPDCLVHRILSAALNLESPSQRNADELQKISTICNVQKYNAKLAGEDCSNVYFISYLKSIQCLTLKASVFQLNRRYLQVVIILTGHPVYIHFADQKEIKIEQIDDDWKKALIHFELDDKEIQSMNVQLFSEVDVMICVGNNNTIKGKLLPPQMV